LSDEGEFRKRDRISRNRIDVNYEDRDGDVPDLTADPKLAHEELGWKAENTLETMCKDLWNWQSQNPKGEFSRASVPGSLVVKRLTTYCDPGY
jgi:GDP-D-mannose dehydratase